MCRRACAQCALGRQLAEVQQKLRSKPPGRSAFLSRPWLGAWFYAAHSLKSCTGGNSGQPWARLYGGPSCFLRSGIPAMVVVDAGPDAGPQSLVGFPRALVGLSVGFDTAGQEGDEVGRLD